MQQRNINGTRKRSIETFLQHRQESRSTVGLYKDGLDFIRSGHGEKWRCKGCISWITVARVIVVWGEIYLRHIILTYCHRTYRRQSYRRPDLGVTFVWVTFSSITTCRPILMRSDIEFSPVNEGNNYNKPFILGSEEFSSTPFLVEYIDMQRFRTINTD